MEDEVTIGIVVAAVLAFLGVVTCTLFWWRFKRWRSSPDTHRPRTGCLLKLFKCVDTTCCSPGPTGYGVIDQNESTTNQNPCFSNTTGSAMDSDPFGGITENTMPRVSDDNRAISVRLARVLGDIGVNRDMVLRRRRTFILWETLDTIVSSVVGGHNNNTFIFGSQTEGTTSPSLGSDADTLYCMNDYNVIQDLAEWQLGDINLLILRDTTTGPGYCRLQEFRSSAPKPRKRKKLSTDNDRPFNEIDDSGRILLKNTITKETLRVWIPDFTKMEGPAADRDLGENYFNQDIILAFPCKSWPYEARPWLVRKRGHWPPQNLLRQVEKSGCFIVAKGQKMSRFQNLEWRISTSLAERMLMFSMNITQLQCYYSLKGIIKTFFGTDPHIRKCVSSYHCKTVVFYSIESSSPQLWREEHLFDCIRYCLQQLHSYLSKGHLPNFFIPEDNLIAERISQSQKSQIIGILDGILSGRGQFLFSISFDDIGHRLQNSFNISPAANGIPPDTLCTDICDELAVNMYSKIAHVISRILHKTALTEDKLRSIVNSLISLARHGSTFQQSAARFLLPSLCSSLGSMIAASDISEGRDLSPAVTALFKYGIQSDAASSRLKLASILYCKGEFKKADQVLQDIEQKYGRTDVQPVCGYYDHTVYSPLGKQFSAYSFDAAKTSFSQNVAYNVIFLPSEMACVPPDLQYEMFRSVGDGEQCREHLDYWMNGAVIDALPFLHYLQYLVYIQVGSSDLQQQALSNLWIDFKKEQNLYHKETVLNLIGKCLEQENRFKAALVLYARSLRIRPRSNAAKFHVTALLYQLYRMYGPKTTGPSST